VNYTALDPTNCNSVTNDCHLCPTYLFRPLQYD